ncbi:MAG: beta-carboxysome assembly chaperone CcmS [Nostochopsis sp.]
MIFSTTQPESPDHKWRRQLDQFVKAHQQELGALAWGLWLENGDTQGTIGIDLQPQPHFVYCSKEAIEKLNDNVENRLQEVLGIIEHYQPEVEVVMVCIGKEQIKLIHFEPQPAPPDCFQQVGKDVNSLLDTLEQLLEGEFQEYKS